MQVFYKVILVRPISLSTILIKDHLMCDWEDLLAAFKNKQEK
jgi:hypothetical protein